MSIITSSAVLKAYLPTPYTNSLNSLPNFTTAEEQYLVPLIGPLLYEQIQQPNPDQKTARLLEKSRAVVAPFGYLMHLPFLQTQLSDNGLVALEATNQRKAYEWEYRNVEEALTALGYSSQEILLLYLQVNKNDYPDWSAAAYNTNNDFPLIRNGADLLKGVTIYQPHRSYMTLRSLLVEVGEFTLRSLLGEEYYTDLGERVTSGDITDPKEKRVVKLLQIAAARLALGKGAVSLNIRYSAALGYTVTDKPKLRPGEGQKGAEPQQLALYMKENENNARAAMDAAKDILDTNASDELFPIYKNSTAYTNPHQRGIKLNPDRRGMFPA